MTDDRRRWDEKYRGERGERRAEPVDFVVEALALLGPGAGRRAVDLAAGTGRHSFELARRGWEVEAWDVSPVGLSILEQRAAEEGVEVTAREVDLMGVELPEARFELAVVVSFLDRPLLPRIQALVGPGGHLVYSAPSRDFPGDLPPMKYRLEAGELEGGIPGFETLHLSEVEGRVGYFGRRDED